ncbi:MAG: VIT and vWA domain-containing protein, partial [Enterovibrio sp.]
MNSIMMNSNGYGKSAEFGFDRDIVLKHSTVNAQLNGAISEVELVHEFVNREKCAIEAVFTFALPLDAVILGLSMVMGARKFIAEVMPKTKGADKYEDAIADGDSAVLLEQVNDGLYSLNVGNLQPNDEVTITIQYAQILNWQDRKLRFYFPCTLGDRYGNQQSANLQPHQQVEHTLDNGARLSFNLTINGELSSALVTSPSHSLTIKRSECALTLFSTNLIPDRDIIITLEALPTFTGEILVEKSDFGLQYCANLLLPNIDDGVQASEHCFQFVIDRSGSMCGDSIEQVQKALAAIKTLLKPSDWFNVVSFGSHSTSLFPSPVRANAEHLAKLSAHIDQLDANMGGTELDKALKLAKKTGRHAELGTQILLITDGEVWDTETIIADAKKAKMRLFSVGVGSAVNEAFLNKLSRSTGASAIFVSPNESMADAIVGQFKRCRQSEIKHFAINWPRPMEEQENDQVLFSGDGYQCYATPAIEILETKTNLNIE